MRESESSRARTIEATRTHILHPDPEEARVGLVALVVAVLLDVLSAALEEVDEIRIRRAALDIQLRPLDVAAFEREGVSLSQGESLSKIVAHRSHVSSGSSASRVVCSFRTGLREEHLLEH